ncbi:Gp138 family membrane-puncturing spike protein [Paenibacillus sp. FSL E2-0177]|uniref:Gp138 family membrane-puncturing spike protein n=1 Tax=Paenibacillus sp. FSL E2-0177 TaxID=2921360 RepID=UPI0030EEC729
MSRANPAGALSRLLGAYAGNQGDDISVAMPCKVISFDDAKLNAVVQPLLKLTSGQPAQIMSVPVIGQKVEFELNLGAGMQKFETIMRPLLKAGDVVYVVCADAELKNTLSGQVAAPDTERRHSRMDAVIVGVLPCSL